MEKAKFYFDRAMAVSGGKFLLADVLCAQYYAIPSQDRGYFKSLLEKVLEFPAQEFPEQRLSNEVSKLRAKKLMENIDEHF